MTVPQMRPMSVGEVLDRSFQTLRRHFGVLFITSLIGFAPFLAMYLMTGTAGSPAVSPATGMPTVAPFFVILFISSMIMTAVLWAALTRQVDADATGGPVTVGAGLGTGFRSLLRVIGAGILIYLAMFGLLIPVGIVGGIAAAVGGATGSTVVMGIIMAVGTVGAGGAAMVIWLSFAFLMVPALVIERLGPIKALRRANELAKGGRLRVSATAVMASLVVMLPAIGLPLLVGVGPALWNPQAAGQVGTVQLYLYQSLTLGVSAITMPFLVATTVYSYYDRRVRREGYDMELESASLTTSV